MHIISLESGTSFVSGQVELHVPVDGTAPELFIADREPIEVVELAEIARMLPDIIELLTSSAVSAVVNQARKREIPVANLAL
jgi:hypothetical protein